MATVNINLLLHRVGLDSLSNLDAESVIYLGSPSLVDLKCKDSSHHGKTDKGRIHSMGIAAVRM